MKNHQSLELTPGDRRPVQWRHSALAREYPWMVRPPRVRPNDVNDGTQGDQAGVAEPYKPRQSNRVIRLGGSGEASLGWN